MKNIGIVLLGMILMSSAGCATSMAKVSHKDQPSAFEESETEQFRTERMLMFNLKNF